MSIIRDISEWSLAFYLPKNNYYIISFPKAGKTWLKFMLNKLMAGIYEGDISKNSINVGASISHAPILNESHDNSQIIHEDGSRPDPHYLFNHDKRYRFRRSYVILLVRDPRDIIVSHYHQVTKRAQNPFEFASISDFVRDPLYGFTRITEFYKIWHQNKNVPKKMRLLKYEELKEDGVDSLVGVLRFMNIDDDYRHLVEQVYEQSTADKMRKLEKANKIEGANFAFGSEENALKVRKGQTHSYLEELPEEDIEYCNKNMADFADLFGYQI